MSKEPETKTGLQRFTIQDAAIADMAKAYMPLVINGLDDKAGTEAVHKARMVCVKSRTGTERVADELNKEAREWIKTVNGEKNRILALIEPIENHLKDEERRIDKLAEDFRNKARLEEEAAERARVEAERLRIKQEQAAENARLAAERAELAKQQAALEDSRKAQQAEASRIKAEQDAALAIERAAIDESRRKLEAEAAANRARIQAEQDKLDAANRAAEAERRRLEEAEAARLRKIEDERLAAEQEERKRVAEKQAEAARQLEIIANLERAERLKPDRERLLTVASCVAGITVPDMLAVESLEAATRVSDILDRAAADIRDAANGMLSPNMPGLDLVAEAEECPF